MYAPQNGDVAPTIITPLQPLIMLHKLTASVEKPFYFRSSSTSTSNYYCYISSTSIKPTKNEVATTDTYAEFVTVMPK